MPHHYRVLRYKFGAALYDAFAAAAACYLALNFSNARDIAFVSLPAAETTIYMSVFVFAAVLISYVHGLHRNIWRYTSLGDFLRILRSAGFTVLFFLPIAFLITRGHEMPRSMPALSWFLFVAFLGAPRILVRAIWDSEAPHPFRFQKSNASKDAVPILVTGASERIEPFVRELRRQHDAPYFVVGILTDDPEWHARRLQGVPVLGAASDLKHALLFLAQRDVRPQRLIVADDQIQEARMADLLELASNNGLTLGRLPSLINFGGSTNRELVHTVALADLLRRPQVAIDSGEVRDLIAGKRVLITGAGGSIGSELARQISRFSPASLFLLDSSEFNLYSIDQEIGEQFPDIERVGIMCDVRNRSAISRWFSQLRPQIVFHAAALKHVPIVEAHPIEGVRTNVGGTQNIADACARFGVSVMTLVSTDKAVNPRNVMGAAKRLAEAYTQAMDCENTASRFLSVRFGNVLGSAGSVVPLFQRQLDSGGPLTVTHPDITRYFMTIPEAVELVLHASSFGSRSDTRGTVYVLDMGEPIKIADMARQMIKLSGKQPDVDIKIEYVGLRPGEKLHEELIHQNEELDRTSTPGIMMASPRTSALPILRQQFQELDRASDEFDAQRLLHLLSTAVPEANLDSPSPVTFGEATDA